ncbi:MAG: NAD(P)H-hydrate dehydratase [Marinosulfonomonas sp.]
MQDLLTAAQMQAIEKSAILRGEVTGLALMEAAGQGVVSAIFEVWPELAATSHHATVLCGPGNNGGDGYVIARLLRNWGWEVSVFGFGALDKLPPDAATNCARWTELGPVHPLTSGAVAAQLGKADLIVDSLFGTGLARSIAGDLAKVIPNINDAGVQGQPVVAVDLPSGLCSDSGRVLGDPDGPCIKADLTVSFHRAKLGHFLADGAWHCGQVIVKDIGLRDVPMAAQEQPAQLFQPAQMTEQLKKHASDHKFSHGHALILSGGVGRGGAARLAARAALRIGAGLVTLGCPPSALQENACRLDAVMLRSLKDDAALKDQLSDARITAMCLGPGLGISSEKSALISAALDWGRPCVLDADALTILAAEPDLFAKLNDQCVLTPHGGEFARLFPDIAAQLAKPAQTGPAFSKADATRAAAKRAGCTVLLKGPDTTIATPQGACTLMSSQYDQAAPWLATAGAGDVLAGFITGLLARGFTPFAAASQGAALHAQAARSFGPGLIAEDLPEQLPAVFRELGL